MRVKARPGRRSHDMFGCRVRVWLWDWDWHDPSILRGTGAAQGMSPPAMPALTLTCFPDCEKHRRSAIKIALLISGPTVQMITILTFVHQSGLPRPLGWNCVKTRIYLHLTFLLQVYLSEFRNMPTFTWTFLIVFWPRKIRQSPMIWKLEYSSTFFPQAPRRVEERRDRVMVRLAN